MITNALTATAGDVIQEVILVPLASLNYDTNIRTKMDQTKLDELAASIAANGQLNAITVVRGGLRTGGTRSYRVVTGHRRVTACIQLGLEYIKAVRADIRIADFPETQLVENLQREDMNPIDEAEAVKRIIDNGKTPSEVSKIIGKTEGWISQRLSLLRLNDTIKEQVRDGVYPISNAIELAKIRSSEKQEKILRMVGKGGVQAIRNARASVEGTGGVKERKLRSARVRTVAEIEAKIDEITNDGAISEIVRQAQISILKWAII